MSVDILVQYIAVFLILAIAAIYLVKRFKSKNRLSNDCGECNDCPLHDSCTKNVSKDESRICD